MANPNIVSVATILGGNAGWNLSTGLTTTLVTVSTTGADATVYLAKVISVPANASLVVSDTPIYLMEGDTLNGGSSAASSLDLFITYETLID